MLFIACNFDIIFEYKCPILKEVGSAGFVRPVT